MRFQPQLYRNYRNSNRNSQNQHVVEPQSGFNNSSSGGQRLDHHHSFAACALDAHRHVNLVERTHGRGISLQPTAQCPRCLGQFLELVVFAPVPVYRPQGFQQFLAVALPAIALTRPPQPLEQRLNHGAGFQGNLLGRRLVFQQVVKELRSPVQAVIQIVESAIRGNRSKRIVR